MKQYNLTLGLTIATILTLSVLPIRLTQGQGDNTYNLIGSEIVIWILCITSWCATYRLQLTFGLRKWEKIVFSLAACAILSNVFYLISNPFFEDYPLSPIREYPLGMAILRLSMRGTLIGLVIVPIVFLFESERQRHRILLDTEKERVKASEIQNVSLEGVVAERTRELKNTLSALNKSRDELDNQVYLLTRLVASVTHDVSSPLNYAIIVSDEVNRLLETGQSGTAYEYSQELLKALTNIYTFMNNTLEFTKTQINKESIVLTDVDLSALVSEKVSLFEGILRAKKNVLLVDKDLAMRIHTNYNLLAVILHNLLDNASRHTTGGVISIETDIIHKRKRLVIANTISSWSGLHSALLEQGRDLRPNHSRSYPGQNRGIGLTLVRSISTLLNIDFSIEFKSEKVIAQLIFNDSPANVLLCKGGERI